MPLDQPLLIIKQQPVEARLAELLDRLERAQAALALGSDLELCIFTRCILDRSDPMKRELSSR
jgi:hypothetical protein